MKANFGLNSESQKLIISHLRQAVANTYSLYHQTLQCHWNIECPSFDSVHKMLQEQYELLAESGDLLAERIRQMGEKVDGKLSTLAKEQQFEDIAVDADWKRMIESLASMHEKAITAYRELSEIGEEHKDFGLVDLLGTLLRDHEKIAWVLRSHL